MSQLRIGFGSSIATQATSQHPEMLNVNDDDDASNYALALAEHLLELEDPQEFQKGKMEFINFMMETHEIDQSDAIEILNYGLQGAAIKKAAQAERNAQAAQAALAAPVTPVAQAAPAAPAAPAAQAAQTRYNGVSESFNDMLLFLQNELIIANNEVARRILDFETGVFGSRREAFFALKNAIESWKAQGLKEEEIRKLLIEIHPIKEQERRENVLSGRAGGVAASNAFSGLINLGKRNLLGRRNNGAGRGAAAAASAEAAPAAAAIIEPNLNVKNVMLSRLEKANLAVEQDNTKADLVKAIIPIMSVKTSLTIGQYINVLIARREDNEYVHLVLLYLLLHILAKNKGNSDEQWKAIEKVLKSRLFYLSGYQWDFESRSNMFEMRNDGLYIAPELTEIFSMIVPETARGFIMKSKESFAKPEEYEIYRSFVLFNNFYEHGLNEYLNMRTFFDFFAGRARAMLNEMPETPPGFESIDSRLREYLNRYNALIHAHYRNANTPGYLERPTKTFVQKLSTGIIMATSLVSSAIGFFTTLKSASNVPKAIRNTEYAPSHFEVSNWEAIAATEFSEPGIFYNGAIEPSFRFQVPNLGATAASNPEPYYGLVTMPDQPVRNDPRTRTTVPSWMLSEREDYLRNYHRQPLSYQDYLETLDPRQREERGLVPVGNVMNRMNYVPGLPQFHEQMKRNLAQEAKLGQHFKKLSDSIDSKAKAAQSEVENGEMYRDNISVTHPNVSVRALFARFGGIFRWLEGFGLVEGPSDRNDRIKAHHNNRINGLKEKAESARNALESANTPAKVDAARTLLTNALDELEQYANVLSLPIVKITTSPEDFEDLLKLGHDGIMFLQGMAAESVATANAIQSGIQTFERILPAAGAAVSAVRAVLSTVVPQGPNGGAGANQQPNSGVMLGNTGTRLRIRTPAGILGDMDWPTFQNYRRILGLDPFPPELIRGAGPFKPGSIFYDAYYGGGGSRKNIMRKTRKLKQYGGKITINYSDPVRIFLLNAEIIVTALEKSLESMNGGRRKNTRRNRLKEKGRRKTRKN